ncbi:hypothetical protein D3C72_1371300 [compost metagenome]
MMNTTCIAMISRNGPADSATSARSSAIMVITRNSDRQTLVIRSVARSSKRRPMNGSRLRIAMPSIMHHRKPGMVIGPAGICAAIQRPPITAASMPASAASAPTVVIGDAAAASSSVSPASRAVERSL